MAADDPKPKPRSPMQASRWSAARLSAGTSNRLLFRLIGIPAAAFAGVLLYRGLQERFVLPECDSARAKSTLADVLKQLKTEPLGEEPIQTVSSGKDQVVCKVALPLSDGGSLNVDYSFFWQGSAVDMRYSIARRPARNSTAEPRQPPPRLD